MKGFFYMIGMSVAIRMWVLAFHWPPEAGYVHSSLQQACM